MLRKEFMQVSIFIFAILLACPNLQSEEMYYCPSGDVTVYVLDSIMTVKFDPSYPAPNYGEFAMDIEGLDEDKPITQDYRDFVIYHIKDGYDKDTVINELLSYPIVMFAFHCYADTGFNVYNPNDLVIISYNDSVGQQTIDSLNESFHIEQISGPNKYTGSRLMKITKNSPGDPVEVSCQLYESGLLKYALPEIARPVLDDYIPDDPLYEYQYNLLNEGQTGGISGIDIEMPKAWAITMGREDVVIAMLDDGFVRYHEDIDSDHILWSAGHDFVGRSGKFPVEDNDPSPGPIENHGPSCQGIIFSTINNGIGLSGVAPNCSLLPIKVFGDTLVSKESAPIYVFENAFSYVLDYATQETNEMVISCSFSWLPTVPSMWVANITAIIDTIHIMGVPTVFSSGNWGEYYAEGYSIGYPAYLPGTIGVGAVRKDGIHWNYSGSGNGLYVVAPSGHTGSWDAGDIYTLDQMGSLGWNPYYVTCAMTDANYLCTFGGTSAAAPQVAGIIALLRSKNPYLFGQYAWILNNSARDGIGDQYDSTGWDPLYGYGLASAFRALLAISRGDVNCSGSLNILDIVYIINYVYKGGPEPIPDVLMADVNCDGVINLMDSDFLIDYLYRGGPAPQICFDYGE